MDKNIEEIYAKIARIIWKFFPKEASCINYYAQLFNESSGYTIDFIIDGKTKWFGFGETPEVAADILALLEAVRAIPPFKGKEQWTHCHVSLLDSGKFNIKFAYISESDSWPNLFMKGISDLTADEAENIYHVPKEIWEERVRLKNSKP
ncbi:immunity protein YezG family protein [Neisseria yangbaofengii]|uniref:immunity protein YezG family protein n=1 Tax=Neisseria yangbaofengii TaxID=2709396 RepID=UPI0013EB7A95|nr:immunity protein YezG family protein [Neisseria yangbaofengii]